jgi:small-conductance mechanosensitive channel
MNDVLFEHRSVILEWPLVALIVILILIVAGLLAFRFVIRDVLAGLVLRREGELSVGRYLLAGEFHGRIERVGLRSLSLISEDGRETRLPYQFLSAIPVTIRQRPELRDGHSFLIELPRAGQVPDEFLRDLREFLLLHPLVTDYAEPTIHSLPGSDRDSELPAFRVTVPCATPAFGDDIEVDVRRWAREG